jgi:hypothetical protein
MWESPFLAGAVDVRSSNAIFSSSVVELPLIIASIDKFGLNSFEGASKL